MALFEIPSFSTLVTEILAKIKEKRPGAATGPGSDADVQSWTLAHVAHGLHLHLKYGVLHQLIPTKASGWVLSAWAWLFGLSDGSGGYGRIVARASSVTDGFTFVALGSGWINLAFSTFTDSTGRRYMINQSYTPVAAGATPALDVICLETGEAGNVEVWQGETYTWETTPSGMDEDIVQVVDLDGGCNEELDAPLRARLAEHLQSPPMGGNWASWKEIAEEASPGNIDAWVWEGLHNATDGYGCTDIACTQRGELGFQGGDKEIETTDALYDTIDAALEANVMYGALFRARLLESKVDVQDVTATITLNPSATDSQRCDWDSETAAFTVSAASSVNLTITASAAVTSYIEVGHRVVIAGAQAVVTKVGIAGGLGADTMIEVDAWFTTYDADTNPHPWDSSFDPTAGPSVLYSGGGIIMDCVDAIYTMFEGMGPYRGTGGVSAPIPGWEDTLRLQNIQSALISVGDSAGDGVVIDVTVTTPATDVTPNTGSDTEVNFLAPDEIVILEAK